MNNNLLRDDSLDGQIPNNNIGRIYIRTKKSGKKRYVYKYQRVRGKSRWTYLGPEGALKTERRIKLIEEMIKNE